MMSPSYLADNRPSDSLNDALAALVKCLNNLVPLQTWMVTRVSGDDWNILYVNDRSNAVKQGQVLSWSSSFCTRMVQGLGPRFAPDAQAVPAYRDAPINSDMTIGAYVGQPLVADDGALIGTLCGLDPFPVEDFTEEQRTIIGLLTQTISTLLSAWTKLEKAQHAQLQLAHKDDVDGLTGLPNRTAWNALMTQAEHTLQSLGENALIVSIRLNATGSANQRDECLVRAAQALRKFFRDDDIVARTENDDFAICMRGVSNQVAPRLVTLVRNTLAKADVPVAIGSASYLSHGTLRSTLQAADASMRDDTVLLPTSGPGPVGLVDAESS